MKMYKATGRAVMCAVAVWTCSGQANSSLDTFTGRFSEVMAPNDRPEYLLSGSPIVRSIVELERRLPTHTAALSPSPWSETFWPMHKGLIANRYLDRRFSTQPRWTSAFDYVFKNPAAKVIATRDPNQIDTLSPAEKYDLLVGDWRFGLTNANWTIGRADYEKHGDIDDWLGLCDGWAMASIMSPEPLHSISVLAKDGRTRLRFYPSDIKALATLLWSYGDFPVRFIGDRCHQRSPKVRDGRIIDPECRDTNAGTWHLAVLNNIGLLNRGLVADMDGKYQVWNFPITSFSFSYKNPNTGAIVGGLEQARVPLSALYSDKFKPYRSHDARYLVGIVMRVFYAVETEPSRNNGPYTRTRDSTLSYDLELDENMNIVGGEWQTLHRPDFMWTSLPGARAVSKGDSMVPFLAGWNGTNPLPSEVTSAAQVASAANQPLAAVVEKLTELSRTANIQ